MSARNVNILRNYGCNLEMNGLAVSPSPDDLADPRSQKAFSKTVLFLLLLFSLFLLFKNRKKIIIRW